MSERDARSTRGEAHSLLIASHPECTLHVPSFGHPERADRLRAALEGAALPGARELAVDPDEERAVAAIRRVHASSFPARLREVCGSAPAVFDSPDNPISAGSYRAAVAAVAACLAAANAVVEGKARSLWVPVRPPGHHALHERAMGFCFFNNIAVVAEELLARGVGPIAIVDFDVHHGNGTQAHFWERDDVFFLSIHRYPFYPGTGRSDETGAGRGRSFTRNIPLAAGADDATYAEALELGLDEIVTAMTPAVWLCSAGFDAHEDDPLGGMALTDNGFHVIGKSIRAAAGRNAVIAALEGGYTLEALRRSVHAFLVGLTEGDNP